MFIDLPMNDGIRRIEDIRYIDHGQINDDSELSSEEVSKYNYYIMINMVKECHCDSYEYLFVSPYSYEETLRSLLKGLSIKKFGHQ